MTVAAVGINRALTRECWAACSPGYVCDQESGLCRAGECTPACVEPNQCTLVNKKLMCVSPERTIVQGIVPPGGGTYTPTADADLGHKEASVPPGTAAEPPVAYAGHSDDTKTMIRRRTSCAEPGSKEWYDEESHASASGSVAGDRHRDFVGVWTTGANALGGSRAIVVTPGFVMQQSARPYDVLNEDGDRLLIRAYPPLPGLSKSEFEVTFLTRHRIDFGGVPLERYDCRSEGPYAELCCRLPRARWVVLGPK